MHRSLGNVYRLSDIVAKGHEPKALRYVLLSTHYRQQLNFTFEGIVAAKNAIERLVNFMRRLLDANGKGSGEEIKRLMERVQKNFEEAMDDDLNVGPALAALFDFVRDVNKLMDDNLLSGAEAKEVCELMKRFDKVLGVIGDVKKEKKLPKEAKELIQKREEARKIKDWATADKIRVQLREMGIIIEDTSEGLRWRFAK
jgi:cysteinyl-tRNA synthetase